MGVLVKDGSTGDGTNIRAHQRRCLAANGQGLGSALPLTVDGEPGFGRVRRAKVVGDDTLVLPLAGEVHRVQLQGGGVLRHLRVAAGARLDAQVRLVVDLGLVQDLIVLLPGEGHGRIAGAGCRADEGHVGAPEGRLGLGLHGDLGLREVVCANDKGQSQKRLHGSSFSVGRKTKQNNTHTQKRMEWEISITCP